MANSKKYIAILTDGEITVHMHHQNANYLTLCSMDGDDPNKAVDQIIVDVPKGAKINCADCSAIWFEASLYSKRDFTHFQQSVQADLRQQRIVTKIVSGANR